LHGVHKERMPKSAGGQRNSLGKYALHTMENY
jgi:hypothetical protein